jgi:fructose-bisphosphate aldolase/2-amino-3,7-dideoxy-D-threo-hept-6-ulosonate synthase
MYTGIRARLTRVSTDDRYLIVPMDHGITLGAVAGLADIESTIDAVTSGGADAVLTQKGIAPRVHDNANGAGYIVHLNGSTTVGPDSNDKRITGSVEEALRAGADAVSVHVNVGSDYEGKQIEDLSRISEEAHRYGVPVLAMTYARGAHLDGEDPEHDPEYLAHAARLGEELGADVIKTAYSGDGDSFRQVVDATRLPVVIAGGSRGTDRRTVEMVRGAMDAGAAGVSMGRSIFQHEKPEAITRAVAAVLHDDRSVEEALTTAGLDEA